MLGQHHVLKKRYDSWIYRNFTVYGGYFILFCAFILSSGCSTLGPHGGSVEKRANKLSAALQRAYQVPSFTANRLSPWIIQSADRYQVPAEWIAATIKQESGYRSGLTSSGGAVGLSQIIPSYWSAVCPGDLYQDRGNIECNAFILARYEKQAGSWFKAAAYYNVGPSGYESSFWTRHKAKKYARSVKRYKKQLQKSL